MAEELPFNKEHILEFIARCKWKWAKTYPNMPHEYIVRSHCELTDDEFVEFVLAQRTGEGRKFRTSILNYLHIDGYKYWTMGNPIPETTIINREKLFDEFNTLGVPTMPEYYSEEKAYMIANAVRQYHEPVFEIGCGDGRIARILSYLPKWYKAVEPCKNFVEYFLQEKPEYRRCVTSKSFEYTSDKWKNFEGVIIGLFGSPNYVMRPYLDVLSRSLKDVFLMFYRDGYIPTPFKRMHAFDYTLQDIKNLFPNRIIYPSKQYYIISSRQIDWEATKNKVGKQLDIFNDK